MLDKAEFALSIRQPWAVLIVSGEKTVEIRNWPAPEKYIGQRILIHAGIALSKVSIPDEVHRMSAEHSMFRGGFIGSAILEKCIKYETYEDWVIGQVNHLNALDSYQNGLYGFQFREPVMFEELISFSGQLKFFKVNENDLKISRD